MKRAPNALVVLWLLACGAVQCESSKERLLIPGVPGLHIMVFEARFRAPLDQIAYHSVAPDFPSRVTYVLTPAGKTQGLGGGPFKDLEVLKLLDVFLFYPEESELRDKNRKARKHENPAVGLMMKILADKWGTADYSLEIQGRYVWPVGKVTVDGVWDETRLVIVPVGKGGAMLFAFTGCQVLQTTFAGGFLFAGPNPNLVGPELVTRTFPEYPTALAGAGWTGMVTLLAEINTSGRILPETVVILSCPHALFASSSLKEITEKWLFRPALRNGQPIRFPATIEVSFRAQR